MTFSGKITPNDLENYRSYLKLISQMQMNVKLRVKEDPSDIVQRVMLQAHKDLDDFRGGTEVEFKAWLTTITSNVIADLARRYSRQRREIAREVPIAVQSLEQSSAILHRALIAKSPSPSEGLIVQEDFNRIIGALMQLLEDERTAIVMMHLHNRPISEIAVHLGRSQSAVGGLLRRGLAKLRSRMKHDD